MKSFCPSDAPGSVSLLCVPAHGAGSQFQLFHRCLPAELCLRLGGRGGKRCPGERRGEMPWCCWDGALVLHLPPRSASQAWPQAEAGGSLCPSTRSQLPFLPSLILGSPCSSSSLSGQGTPCPLSPAGAITLPGPGCTGRSRVSTAGDR